MEYIQQGDTIYVKSTIPSDAQINKDFDGVVQHGESTGHAHRLHGDGFTMFQTKEKRYLRLLKETPLRHEEHDEIKLPSGDYEVRIVREYDHFQDLTRPVVD